MSSWPSPQKTSQWNVNVPALSGVNGTRVTSCGTHVRPDPERGQVEPVEAVLGHELEDDGLALPERHLGRRVREPLRDDADDPRPFGTASKRGRRDEPEGEREGEGRALRPHPSIPSRAVFVFPSAALTGFSSSRNEPAPG